MNQRMSKVVEVVFSENANYVAEFGDKGNLPMPPGCLDPAKYAGLTEGHAHGDLRNDG